VWDKDGRATASGEGDQLLSRFAVTHGDPERLQPQPLADADGPQLLAWSSEARNATRDISHLRAIARVPLPPVLEDLLDIATAVFLADIAAPRGMHDEWTRAMAIEVPVSMPDFWKDEAPLLSHLLYTLTRDSIEIGLTHRPRSEREDPVGARPVDVDCVCLLSGGLDSLAGAAMLLRAGRRPLLVSHQSGNPTVESAQKQVVAALHRLWPGKAVWVGVRVSPARPGPRSLPFPPPQARESSRRARAILIMAIGVVAAHMTALEELYMAENGILTAALPLSVARSGSLSTRSTHPLAIALLSGLLQKAAVPCTFQNPFMYQTKGEIVRTFLKPTMPPRDILSTVSCWATGRYNRQCGGCVPCLLRRFALLSAGLPDEAYMMDVLERPEHYRGTEVYGNPVDLLNQAAAFLGSTDLELLIEYPQVLDLTEAGVSIEDTLKTYRRHAAEVFSVVDQHFPAAAKLMRAMHA